MTLSYLYKLSFHRFQSTLPQGEWPQEDRLLLPLLNFNPHSRKGSDASFLTDLLILSNFNPHSRKGSDKTYHPWQLLWFNFNPHSRKGSDISTEVTGFYFGISIHTPARGVTKTEKRCRCRGDISIHTPARGVTQNGDITITDKNDFNPHSRKGSDNNDWRSVWWIGNFNPHSRKGSDQLYVSFTYAQGDFNPHSRKGSDQNDSIWATHLTISIHTPARGVTFWPERVYWLCQYFNPHSRKGSDNVGTGASWLNSQFQSTLPQGEWQTLVTQYRGYTIFQSTLPQGEWPVRHSPVVLNHKFQSTLPQGEWQTSNSG